MSGGDPGDEGPGDEGPGGAGTGGAGGGGAGGGGAGGGGAEPPGADSPGGRPADAGPPTPRSGRPRTPDGAAPAGDSGAAPRDPRVAGRPPWDAPPPDLPVEIRPAAAPGSLPEVRAEPGYEALAGFLVSDLQGGLGGIERLLAQLERVERGEVGAIERSGNAYLLRLRRRLVSLHPLHDDRATDCRLDPPLLRRVLAAWRAALEG